MTWGLHSDLRLAILYNVRRRAEVTLTSLLMQSLWDKINLHTSPYWSNSSLALPSLNWLAHVWKEIDGFVTLRSLSGAHPWQRKCMFSLLHLGGSLSGCLMGNKGHNVVLWIIYNKISRFFFIWYSACTESILNGAGKNTRKRPNVPNIYVKGAMTYKWP